MRMTEKRRYFDNKTNMKLYWFRETFCKCETTTFCINFTNSNFGFTGWSRQWIRWWGQWSILHRNKFSLEKDNWGASSRWWWRQVGGRRSNTADAEAPGWAVCQANFIWEDVEVPSETEQGSLALQEVQQTSCQKAHPDFTSQVGDRGLNSWNRTFRRHGSFCWCCRVPLKSTFFPIRNGTATGKWCRELRTLLSL